MSEEGYNGWSNYETWVTALWMDNDEGSYGYARELVAGARETDYPRVALLTALEEWHEEFRPDLGANVWSDLLGHAFSQVNWYEIAVNLLAETADV
jgi:hypothetical protein